MESYRHNGKTSILFWNGILNYNKILLTNE
jgi:hypothetical protein